MPDVRLTGAPTDAFVRDLPGAPSVSFAPSSPQWVHALTLALIDLIRAWHRVTVSDFCGQNSDRCVAIQSLERARARVAQLSSKITGRGSGGSDGESESESESEFQRAAKVAEQCNDALREAGPTAEASAQLQSVTKELRARLVEYQQTASKLVSEHASMALGTVVGVFEFAIWSVTATDESVALAHAAMKEGRAHGRRKVRPAALSCAQTCAEIRTQWGVLAGSLTEFVEATAKIQGSDGLRVLLDAMKVSMVGVQFDEASNTATCASRIQYVLQQLENMERLIVDIAQSDKRVTTEITEAQRLEGAARAAFASLTKSLGELTARKQLAAQREPTVNAGREIDIGEVVKNTTARIQAELDFETLLRKREQARKDMEQKQAATKQAIDRLESVKLARDSLALVGDMVAAIQKLRADASAWMENCMRVDVTQMNIDSTVDWHGATDLCRIATLAEADFNAMADAALAQFQASTETLVDSVGHEMQRHRETAWRHILAGQQGVHQGSYAHSLMPALIAEQQLHAAEMRRSQARYATAARADFEPVVGAGLEAATSTVDGDAPATGPVTLALRRGSRGG